MASATMLLPLSEYLTTSYEHDCEWVEGEVRERGVPDEYHSAIQTFFIGYFLLRQQDLSVRVRAELRVRVAERRYRIPDVTLLPASAPVQAIPDIAPVLCIEILSPDDSWGEMQEKIREYVAMGVGAVWIVDPRRRLMYAADASGTHGVERLELAGTNVSITGGELFAELDGIVER